MKTTATKDLIDIITIKLKLIERHIFHINEEYFLKKEQEQMDKFAIEFARWYSNANYNLVYHYTVEDEKLLEIFKKEKGYI